MRVWRGSNPSTCFAGLGRESGSWWLGPALPASVYVKRWREKNFRGKALWDEMLLASLPRCCVTFSKGLHLSEHPFPCIQTANIKRPNSSFQAWFLVFTFQVLVLTMHLPLAEPPG